MTRPLMLALLAALAVIAACLMGGCVSGPVTLHVAENFRLDSNTLSAIQSAVLSTNGLPMQPGPSWLSAALTAVAVYFGVPVPAVVGTGGAAVLTAVLCVVVGLRKKKQAKEEAK